MSEGSFAGTESQGGVDFCTGEAFQEAFDLDTLEIVWEINKKPKKPCSELL